jgi:hypothetical protein
MKSDDELLLELILNGLKFIALLLAAGVVIEFMLWMGQ